jgi:hypothetical protein
MGMWKQIWGQAAVIAMIVVPVSIIIFVALMLFLELFHDFALALGTIIFIAISAGAWILARRAEEDFARNQQTGTAEQE